MRCRSWRARPAHVPAHAPGTCRKCWRPCRSTVEPGAVRCHDCVEALITHPDPAIRRGALNCHLDAAAVIRLFGDLTLSVHLAAREVLADMQIELDDTAPTTTPDQTWDEIEDLAS